MLRDMIQVLTKSNVVDINAKDSNGNTTLHNIISKSEKRVDLLINANNISLNEQNKDGLEEEFTEENDFGDDSDEY